MRIEMVIITRKNHKSPIDTDPFDGIQYHYTREDGVKMDVICLPKAIYPIRRWEIYGGPIEDVERFETKAEAELAILYYLYAKND